jgi:glycosyltransferase involved in cell wall biosynthesis
MSTPRLSIILPVYRQADHIGPIVADYAAALDKLDASYELLLVVNGAGDNSQEVCAKLDDEVPSVRAIMLEGSGWGRAVKCGVRHAEGELICYTNSARTSAHDLQLLLMYALVYPEVVVKANRKIRESFTRRLGSLMYNLECRALFDLSAWDINGTPKVFPRSFAPLLDLQEDGDLIDLEFNVLCRRHEYQMVEVPIFSKRRHGGKSTTNYGTALRLYSGAWTLKRDWPHEI